mmetsp:Transcript_9797/g.16161  ORF Transcript_9797/g.16161 Transcript_9797/m.16161 type:complete len:284 (+) Transcript_9797:106-957(+)
MVACLFALFFVACLVCASAFKLPVRARTGSALGMSGKDVLYDVPVSNHGARLRIIIKEKCIQDQVTIVSPTEIGGLKSSEYLKLNRQGKMPLYLSNGVYPIPDSDSIARFILDKFSDKGPSFAPADIMQRSLSDQICRHMDMYISPIQGTVYKAPGTPYSVFGTDRKLGLAELKKQLLFLEQLLGTFEAQFPDLSAGPYLCGSEISLADVYVFPTMVFLMFTLPQFFGWSTDEYLGPRLQKWWQFMTTEVASTKEVFEEMEGALNAWKSNGRWDPIVEEMKGK